MKDKKELTKQILLYLGKENAKWLLERTEKEKKLLNGLNLNLKKSYIVYGNKDILSKFKAHYLAINVKSHCTYGQYYVDEYVNSITSPTKDDYGLNIDQDLVFIYVHEYSISTIGNTELWITGVILNKVANRNRSGLVTIILSEARIPLLDKSSELEVINLSKVVKMETIQEAAKEIKLSSSGTSNPSRTMFE